MTEPRVHYRHARQILRNGGKPLCANGIETWCDRHGIDLRELVETGIAGERIRDIGDAFALRALEIARAEAADGIK